MVLFVCAAGRNFCGSAVLLVKLKNHVQRSFIGKAHAAGVMALRRTVILSRKIKQLIQPETHFHAYLHIHRLTVLLSGLKSPLLHGFDCFGIQAKS